jgi:hypothetical protein
MFSTKLGIGTHSITAVYNGSANDLASTSAAVTQVVNGPGPQPPPCQPGRCM